jgi:hypothetical protein
MIRIVYTGGKDFQFNLICRSESYLLFIPLRGKFAVSGQLSFFCGYPRYSSGPYVNSDGLKILSDIIERSRQN